MGICCSVDEAAVRESDKLQRNPIEPHPDWVEKLAADVGSDVFAVARDFPRMNVVVGEPRGGDHPPPTPREHERKGTRRASPDKENHEPTFEDRAKKIVDCVMTIADICKESETLGRRLRAWWNDIKQGEWSASKEARSLLSQPDSNPLMRSMMISAQLVDAIPSSTKSCGSDGEPISLLPSDSPARKERNGVTTYRPNCKTFRVLEYLVQGTVFFPVQRLHHLMWFPWAKRLTDVSWSSFVYTKPSSFPEHIYVVHRQVTRNYVEPDAKDTTPVFEIEWDLVLTLSSQDGSFVDAAMTMRRATIVSSRVVESPLCGCCSSDGVFMKCRIDQLNERLLDSFQISAE